MDTDPERHGQLVQFQLGPVLDEDLANNQLMPANLDAGHLPGAPQDAEVRGHADAPDQPGPLQPVVVYHGYPLRRVPAVENLPALAVLNPEADQMVQFVPLPDLRSVLVSTCDCSGCERERDRNVTTMTNSGVFRLS